jgi:GTPase SAR1 family protein
MSATSALSLTERLCRPQRVGLFGHRGVGKTTLLTMLYREAVAGRLPGLRLAAGDAVTANYLGDKLQQLETGNVLPATLAETELRFNLYRGDTRLELIVKDYQGEQVALGRQEPIREFLKDCDAVLLCFDPALLDSRKDQINGEQEAEQIIEDYLGLERGDCPHRPMALVLTKADLLPPKPPGISEELWLSDIIGDAFGMTLHALRQHAPSNALFAVSSLGRNNRELRQNELHPWNLERPLSWLTESLQAQDEARIDTLLSTAGGSVTLLGRCVRCHAQRYPGSPRRPEYEEKLRKARTRRRRTRGLIAAAVALLAAVGLWASDALRYHSAQRFESSSGDLEAVRDRWQDFTASPLSIGFRDSAEERLSKVETRLHEQKREQELASLRRLAEDPASRTTAVLASLRRFAEEFPDTPGLAQLRADTAKKVQALREREGQEALDGLIKSEHLSPTRKGGEGARKHLEGLVVQADRVLEEFADIAVSAKVHALRAAYIHRIDEHDFESARAYSSSSPDNFATRRERYQEYLSRHPQGAFASQARAAIPEIETAWDKHDFRSIRDLYVKKAHEFEELTARCTRYLAVHDKGRYRDSAKELIAWAGRVNQPREYTVTVVEGDFPLNIGRWFTKGPKLTVEIEVNGVKHGPTNIVKNNYDPKWNYTFPRRVTWKPGDSVRIIVRDHNYSTKSIVDYVSSESDRLAMKLLSEKFELEDKKVWFESDFKMPKVPDID